MKETAKRHAAALNRGVKRTRAGALLDDKGEVQPIISPEDFEKQQFDKEAEKAKQKKLRALKKEESLGSQGSASSFDFFKRGGSESPKKKKGKRPMSPAEKQGASAKSKSSKIQKTPKVAAAFAGGSGGLTFRSRAKQSRSLSAFRKLSWRELTRSSRLNLRAGKNRNSAFVFKARDKLKALLNEDADWMLFANGPSLTEEGLFFKLNLQKSGEKLGVIGTVLEAQETRTAKASVAQRPAHVHSLRDAVARVEAWNKLNVSHKVKVHVDLQEQVLHEVVDECCKEMNTKRCCSQQPSMIPWLRRSGTMMELHWKRRYAALRELRPEENFSTIFGLRHSRRRSGIRTIQRCWSGCVNRFKSVHPDSSPQTVLSRMSRPLTL